MKIVLKNRFSRKILFLFIFCSFFFAIPYTNSITNSSNEFKTSNQTNMVNQISNPDYWLDYAKSLANVLIVNANYTSDGVYWRKILNQPDVIAGGPSQISYGYYYGTAGIADQLLDLYSYVKNITYIEIAQKAADFIINNRFYYNDRIAWTRANDSYTVYMGIKYGYAGIVKFFLHLYSITDNATYLDYSNEALSALIQFGHYYNTTDSVSWGYSWDFQDSMTDYTYGSAGIAETFLEAYEITNNVTYFDYSEKAMKWALDQSERYSSNGYNYLAIYTSAVPDYHFNYTGLGTGQPGIGNVLLELYDKTKDQNYLESSADIGHWLVSVMLNGIWDYGGIDVFIDAGNYEGTFLGYMAGSAGIGTYFLDLFNKTNDQNFLYPVKITLEALERNIISENNYIYWLNQLKGTFSSRITSDLSFGEAGIGLFYAAVEKYFGDYFNTTLRLQQIDAFFRAKQDPTTGFIPYDLSETTTTPEYQSDYFNGLAGILSFYLHVADAMQNTPQYNKSLIDSVTGTPWTVVSPISSDSSLQSSITSSDTITTPNNMIVVFISLMTLYTMRKRLRK